MMSESGPSAWKTFQLHGELPYCGRSTQLSELEDFWAAALREGEGGCVLVEGAEGEGKSRLLRELARACADQDSRILQAAWGSLAPGGLEALAEALESGQSPAGKRSGPQDAEARLTRLLATTDRRPFLLLLDECERMPFEAGLALISLLRGLRNQPFLVVLAGRPPLLLLRSSLEPLLLRTLRLELLREEDVRQLWQRLFSQDASPALCLTLAEASAGSPLALRHLLRRLIEAGWIQAGEGGRSRLIPAELKELCEALMRDFCLGRLAALQPAQRRDLQTLGALGPVFSREAARRLLGSRSDELLDALELARLAGPPLIPPLRVAGPPSREPLVELTDSLLASWISSQADALPEEALDLLAGDWPLYSLVPFLRMEQAQLGQPEETWLRKLLEASEKVVLAQQRSADPARGEIVSQAAWVVLERHPQWRGIPALRLAACRLLIARLFLLRGQAGASAFLEQVQCLLELTRAPDDPIMAELRLQTLIHLHRHHLRLGDSGLEDVRQEIVDLQEAHPVLRRHQAFRIFLGDLGLMAWGRGQHGSSGWVEEQMNLLLRDEPAAAARTLLLQRVGVTLLAQFETRAEEEARLELARELSISVPASDAVFPALRLHMLLQAGRLGEFLDSWESAREIWIRRGLRRNLEVALAWHQAVLVLCGEEPQRLVPADAASKDPFPAAETLRELPLLQAALLTGHADWAGRRLLTLQVSVEADRAAKRLQYHWAHQTRGRAAELRALRGLPASPEDPPRLLALLTCLANLDEGRVEEGRQQARRLLELPPARLDHLLILQTLLSRTGRQATLQAEARQALEDAFTWCVERQLGWVVRAWSRQFGELLGAPRRRGWARRSELARVWSSGGHATQEAGVEGAWLQLIGGTRLRLAGQSQERRIRGARMRCLLAALVADQALREPLPLDDFRALATGVERGEAAGRTRNILAIGVHRLRQLLGPDAVLGAEGRPRLNPARIQVDVLRVIQDLEAAEEALRGGRPQAARQRLDQVLGRLRRGLPFQDQYQALFESLRDDLESRTRALGMETARLLAERDGPEARPLLEQLFHWHPDDEEVAGWLARSLEAEGRSAEALVVLGLHRQALRSAR